MYDLKAERRSANVKSKTLRRAGKIPGSVYGGTLEETLLIQVPESEATKLLKLNARGKKVNLEIDGSQLVTLLKEVECKPVENQVMHLSFQSLVPDKVVTSTAQIVLTNREKVPGFIQQVLFEIPYKALPKDIIENVSIDLTGMKSGSSIKLEDLDIAKNEALELSIERDSLVLTIADKVRDTSSLNETADAE